MYNEIEQKRLADKGLKYECSDLGNTDRFVAQHGDKVKFIREIRRWAEWDGTRWGTEDARIEERVAETVRGIYNEAAECPKGEGQLELAKWAVKSQSSNAFGNIKARASERLSISIERFDTDDEKLNCLNGLVDLETGALIEHSSDQLLMKRAEVNYVSGAGSETWFRFINDIFLGDMDVIQFMQRSLGYSLTGLTKDHHLFIAYGRGANGKSTLFEVILEIMGGYARMMEIDVLLNTNDKGNVRVLEQQGRLKGNRLAIASEVPSNKRFSEEIVKRLTGADTLTGAKLRGDSYEFKPTHKIWIQCNHLPAAKDASYGFWRRPIVIPFNAKFNGDRVDKELRQKLLAEREGIFAWLVEGARMYLEDGLGKIPQACIEATKQYRSDNDELQRFIDERLDKEVGGRIGAADMYAEYGKWCEKEGIEKKDIKRFPGDMVERGIVRKPKDGKQFYIGYRFSERGIYVLD
jgi:putative DNA primase/helicase